MRAYFGNVRVCPSHDFLVSFDCWLTVDIVVWVRADHEGDQQAFILLSSSLYESMFKQSIRLGC